MANLYSMWKYIKLLIPVLLFSCAGEPAEDAKVEENKKYPDGKYCANVAYENPKTGTHKNYTFNVEVSSNELTKVFFGNGGYLDNSHFSPAEINDEGRTSFTDDRSREFDIQILGAACTSTDDFQNDEVKQIPIKDCAASISMTESELAAYEKDFKVSRNDLITDEFCKKMVAYISKSRELNRKKKELEDKKAKGYIQNVTVVNKHGKIDCQTAIVLRYGKYYLWEVTAGWKVTMGITDFDPNNNDWQFVTIQERPDNDAFNMYNIRVVAESYNLADIESEMNRYCFR